MAVSDSSWRRPGSSQHMNYSHPFSSQTQVYSHENHYSTLAQNKDINDFENRIPIDGDPSQRSRNRQRRPADAGYATRFDNASSIAWPLFLVTVPITLLCAALLAIIYEYRVQSEPGIFATPDSVATHDRGSILVNYPATRLVFIASFLSSLAPTLAGFIMALWALPIAKKMQVASLQGQHAQLPTPYQLSLLVGVSLASYERLWQYFVYSMSNARAKIPRLLHQDAVILCTAILLACSVFVTDTYLHYVTSTIQFDLVTKVANPTTQLGRGLSEYCLVLDRASNSGFPCSYDPLGLDPDWSAQENEVFRLQHSISKRSEIQFWQEDEFAHGDLAILVPRDKSSELDFHASTIGVSSQCSPITKECDLRVSNQGDGLYTLFNCSNGFWGVLGKAPQINELDGVVELSPDIPPLGYKPAANMQYGFFSDFTLNTAYNSVGYNITTDQSTLADNPPEKTFLSDTDLSNPIYFAIATRFSNGAQLQGDPLDTDANVFSTTDHTYSETVLRCSLTSYSVDYTWVKNQLSNVTSTPSPNGTFLEIFHGSQFYISVSGDGFDLQDYLLQAAIQPSSAAFAKTWANLYSTKILSTIGGFSSPRTTIAEQIRTPLLVSKVPVSALAALVACALSYTVLGVVLGVAAYRASSPEVRDIAGKLSLPGLAYAAFGDEKDPSSGSVKHGQANVLFGEKQRGGETCRVLVDGSSGAGYKFRVWL